MEIFDLIRKQLSENPILLYMKGTPAMPQCGFSAQVIEILMECGEKFAFVNILEHPNLRRSLPEFANWPTFPQLWVKGELLGGCDIVVEMHTGKELMPLLQQAVAAGQTYQADGVSGPS